jgi:hypothetical protein
MMIMIEHSLYLRENLKIKIAETRDRGEEDIVFGTGLARISDMEIGLRPLQL